MKINFLKPTPQYKQALDLFEKINLELLSGLRESFVTLYYPKRNGLVSDDITMEFEENNYNLEDQIKKLLIDKMKFDTDINSKEFRDKFEDRIFTQRQMTWNSLKERAATMTAWSWHHPNALDDLKANMLRRDEWTEAGGYLDKEPPAPETSLTFREVHEDENTGEVTLKLIPQYGDEIYYEIGQDATRSSLKINDINNFKTKELKLSFLCIDSKGKNPTGKTVEWIRNVKVKYKPYDKDGKQLMELKATADNVKILYTTDGSNPRESGGIYDGDFIIPDGAKFIQAIAVNERLGIYSEPIQIEVKKRKFEIDRDKELRIIESIMYNNTADTFKGLEELEKIKATVSGIILSISNNDNRKANEFIELTMGDGIKIDNPKAVLYELERILKNFFEEKEFEVNLTINKIIFETGRDFEQWVSSKKETIDDYKGKISQ